MKNQQHAQVDWSDGRVTIIPAPLTPMQVWWRGIGLVALILIGVFIGLLIAPDPAASGIVGDNYIARPLPNHCTPGRPIDLSVTPETTPGKSDWLGLRYGEGYWSGVKGIPFNPHSSDWAAMWETITGKQPTIVTMYDLYCQAPLEVWEQGKSLAFKGRVPLPFDAGLWDRYRWRDIGAYLTHFQTNKSRILRDAGVEAYAELERQIKLVQSGKVPGWCPVEDSRGWVRCGTPKAESWYRLGFEPSTATLRTGLVRDERP